MARNTRTEENANLSYLQLISQDKEERKQEELQLTAQEAALELNQIVFSLTKDISRKNSQIASLKRAVPYNVISEYKATKELEELETRLAFVRATKEARFADITI